MPNVGGLELEKRCAIRTAKDLRYSKECIDKLKKAENAHQIYRILKEERRKKQWI